MILYRIELVDMGRIIKKFIQEISQHEKIIKWDTRQISHQLPPGLREQEHMKRKSSQHTTRRVKRFDSLPNNTVLLLWTPRTVSTPGVLQFL